MHTPNNQAELTALSELKNDFSSPSDLELRNLIDLFIANHSRQEGEGVTEEQRSNYLNNMLTFIRNLRKFKDLIEMPTPEYQAKYSRASDALESNDVNNLNPELKKQLKEMFSASKENALGLYKSIMGLGTELAPSFEGYGDQINVFTGITERSIALIENPDLNKSAALMQEAKKVAVYKGAPHTASQIAGYALKFSASMASIPVGIGLGTGAAIGAGIGVAVLGALTMGAAIGVLAAIIVVYAFGIWLSKRKEKSAPEKFMEKINELEKNITKIEKIISDPNNLKEQSRSNLSTPLQSDQPGSQETKFPQGRS